MEVRDAHRTGLADPPNTKIMQMKQKYICHQEVSLPDSCCSSFPSGQGDCGLELTREPPAPPGRVQEEGGTGRRTLNNVLGSESTI